MKKSGADEMNGKFMYKIATKSVHIRISFFSSFYFDMEISNLQSFDR